MAYTELTKLNDIVFNAGDVLKSQEHMNPLWQAVMQLQLAIEELQADMPSPDVIANLQINNAYNAAEIGRLALTLENNYYTKTEVDNLLNNSLITFTLDGKSYSIANGTTWEQLINIYPETYSTYISKETGKTYVKLVANSRFVMYQTNIGSMTAGVQPTDLIMNNHKYTTTITAPVVYNLATSEIQSGIQLETFPEKVDAGLDFVEIPFTLTDEIDWEVDYLNITITTTADNNKTATKDYTYSPIDRSGVIYLCGFVADTLFSVNVVPQTAPAE